MRCSPWLLTRSSWNTRRVVSDSCVHTDSWLSWVSIVLMVLTRFLSPWFDGVLLVLSVPMSLTMVWRLPSQKMRALLFWMCMLGVVLSRRELTHNFSLHTRSKHEASKIRLDSFMKRSFPQKISFPALPSSAQTRTRENKVSST